jgi:hypothetical protein
MKTFPCWWIENGRCACPKGGEPEHRSAGKHPITANGSKDATDDPEQIAEWRARWPKANWGIATGEGLIVVDLDVKPGKNGMESLKALGTVPRTRMVKTGGGGRHLYFLGNASNSSNKVGQGIDVRGTGGYVMAPGSNHESGGTYELILDLPPVPLPDWLADLIEQESPTRDSDGTPPVDRGFFPAASPAVLTAAREALEDHGPAIEGEGGDQHTFRAAALLTHDFALTDAEAWPLLQEWNETCEPPWKERELKSKLRGGLKYGSNEYGCRRTMDCLETVKKVLGDWQTSNGGESTMFAMLDKIRRIPFDDQAKLSVAERDIKSATGLKSKDIGLKLRTAVKRPTGAIEVTTQLHEVADQALKAIAPKVFMRNGVLCEVAKNADRTFISDLEPARILDLMSECSKFFRVDEKAGIVSQAPPPAAAAILHARRMHNRVRVLEAITTAPVFLADGSILQDRGYNAQARVFLEPSVTVDVDDAPTLEDAEAAVAAFKDLLCDFKFSTPADFSSWLAGLLSPLVKAATGNAPAPLICVSASSPGAGKTLLTKAISQIITGGDAEIRPYNPRDASEWGKRLTSFVKAGSPVSVFDNVNGLIGDEGLDRLITSSTWSDRQLGASEAPPLPNVSAWFATGNNIEPHGDTVRRVLMVRIEVDTERPQERSGFRYDLDGGYVLEHRSELLSHALTILRAYHAAGRPAVPMPSWGSFTTWSTLVRGALIWAGAADPFETQKRAAAELNESDNDAHDFWLDIVEQAAREGDGSPVAVVSLGNQRDAPTVLGLRQELTSVHLKRFLGRFIDKPRQGKRIRKDGARYYVEKIPTA